MVVVNFAMPVNSSSEDVDMKKKKKATRSAKELTTLDSFLKDEGKLEEFEAVAIKEVLAWQIAEAMKTQTRSFRSGAVSASMTRNFMARYWNVNTRTCSSGADARFRWSRDHWKPRSSAFKGDNAGSSTAAGNSLRG